MKPLDKSLRRSLEAAVVKARDIAEAAAREDLQRLTVGDAVAGSYLNDEQRKLRNRLRAHGRQLGDMRKADAIQSIEHLVAEVAYEHWHRMLFARFLAENNLLMYEDGVTPLSLQDCFDLAKDEGGEGWEYAARYAAKMLPQIFRPDSPAFSIKFAPNHQHALEKLLMNLDAQTFQASDALGWVYQFWQSKKKEQVNASEVKIGADELPAVTQLFTEPYMVSFLLDNALGAWWATRRLSEIDLQTASSEEDLRRKASIPGVPLEYLRFVKQDDGKWMPAAGTFDAWPGNLNELKTLDPCCGSGHFLVAAFMMLVPMRMEMEGLSAKEAVDAVLRENIHGLELDQRCVELAAFALALTAWKYPSAGGYRVLPELQLACSGLSVSVAKEEWKKLGLGKQNLSIALDWIHDMFKEAPILGSLLNPAKSDAAQLVQWNELSTAIKQALAQEQTDEQQEVAVIAQGLSKAATLLAGQYQWVITNVPYLSRGKQHEVLRDYCEKHYPAGKNDLATVFLDRCLELCVEGGTSSIVLPQNWLFLTSYKKFREKLLRSDTWHLIARLGAGAFETISGEVVKAILINISRGNASRRGLMGSDCPAGIISGVDVSGPRTAVEKAASLLTTEIKSVEQAKQLDNPDARITFNDCLDGILLADTADFGKGSTTGDGLRFLLYFWEFASVSDSHVFWLNSPSGVSPWSGRSQVCKVPLGDDELNAQLGCWLRGGDVYGRQGVVVNKMRRLEPFLYSGEVFDDNVCPICPKNSVNIPASWAYISSREYHSNVRSVDQSLKVTAGTITKVPFDLERWTKVAKEQYPNGLPKPYTDDPTQWIFHGHPCGSVVWNEDDKWTAHGSLRTDKTVLHTAITRLLSYRWPAELDLSACGDAQAGADMELADEQREWVNRCEALLPLADDDGIVCLSVVRGEKAAADRLEAMLQAAFGDAWSSNVRNKLLKAVDCQHKSLNFWLREKFFEQHCKLFQHRPFIWHVWDGLKDGFSALLNYHQFDKQGLERLIYTYLDDWIRTQTHQQAEGVDGADIRLQAAQGLKQRLKKILKGEKPYDIFVRWKPLDQQPIGWNPDINDGVRLNIRPFMAVEDVGRRGAGILRFKPNIHWKKDRGKDVASAPWYSLGLEYGGKEGDRINDHHIRLLDKQAVAVKK